ncbi:Uncharacterised protein [Bordetella pertussis]|nr:Uncharacterised protein [Bordetella pertussis]
MAAVSKVAPTSNARRPPPRVKCPSRPGWACIITIFKLASCYLSRHGQSKHIPSSAFFHQPPRRP